jgi:hypothetical protein
MAFPLPDSSTLEASLPIVFAFHARRGRAAQNTPQADLAQRCRLVPIAPIRARLAGKEATGSIRSAIIENKPASTVAGSLANGKRHVDATAKT